MTSNRRIHRISAVGLVAAAVFFVDLLTPRGIEVWVLYLPVILFLVLFNNPRRVLAGSWLCSLLVVIASIFSPPGGNPLWWDFLNRGFGLMAIWLSAFRGILICTRTAQLAKALADLQQESDSRRQAEETLREHEERLRLAMEGGEMGTWDVNFRTGKVMWSQTHFRMLGYEPAASGEATREMWLCRVHPDDRKHVLEAQEKARRERSIHCPEYRIQRPDNPKPVWLAVFGRFLYDGKGEAIRFIGVSFDITRRKELESEVLRISARQQQEIGQELHDGVGQELTGLGLMAESLTQRLTADATEKQIASRLAAGLNRTHQKVRELARGLIPVHVEARGLAAALNDMATRTSVQSGVLVSCECPEWVEMPDHETATQIFRIVQEAVSNSLRHGRPGKIRLTLLSEPDGLRLRINDDGIGFKSRKEASEGLGFRIMEYRAGLIGGILQIRSSEGGGTTVTLTIPRSRSYDEKEHAGWAAGENRDRG